MQCEVLFLLGASVDIPFLCDELALLFFFKANRLEFNLESLEFIETVLR